MVCLWSSSPLFTGVTQATYEDSLLGDPFFAALEWEALQKYCAQGSLGIVRGELAQREMRLHLQHLGNPIG